MHKDPKLAAVASASSQGYLPSHPPCSSVFGFRSVTSAPQIGQSAKRAMQPAQKVCAQAVVAASWSRPLHSMQCSSVKRDPELLALSNPYGHLPPIVAGSGRLDSAAAVLMALSKP